MPSSELCGYSVHYLQPIRHDSGPSDVRLYNNGTGIISTSADNITTSVGYAEAGELGIDGGGSYTNQEPTTTNTTITDETVILKQTYVGDFDLDGSVTGSDFLNWSGSLPVTDGSADWYQGDADYDGNITIADFIAWGGNFPASGLSGRGGGPVPVPEPSTLVLAALGLAGLATVSRRRRSSV
jgi:hypothetical protein